MCRVVSLFLQAMAGVVAYVSAKDIPEGGQNTFLPTPVFEAEPVCFICSINIVCILCNAYK